MDKPLSQKIAIVTGASRGIGKGIALGLGEAGATVYVTGRTAHDHQSKWPGTITKTAEEVTSLGGRGFAFRCDHRDDADVKKLFEKVGEEHGRLDILVNNATSFGETPESRGYDPEVPFWELPISQWDEIIDVGLRSYYVSSLFAAQMMIHQQRGLIVNVSSGGAVAYAGNIGYGVGKAGVDKLSADTAHQLRPHGIAVVSIWPSLTKTEKVMTHAQSYDLNRAVSPLFSGRAVARLASDPHILDKTGKALKVLELAKEYGFKDTS